MLSTNLKFSKLQLQKSLFEEYRLTAAEILYELEEILQKYAVYNITFPVGIVNLVDYSWHDLTADAYKYATKNPMLKKCSALKDDTSIMTMIDLKGYKINSCSREECHKRNCLVKVKEDHHDAASKPAVKTCKQKLLVRLINNPPVLKIKMKMASKILKKHYINDIWFVLIILIHISEDQG